MATLAFPSSHQIYMPRGGLQKQLTTSTPNLGAPLNTEFPRRRLLHSELSKNPLQEVARNDLFDPTAYALREHYQHKLDKEVLNGITFNEESTADQQHLDIGCGTGGFTKSVLLPLSHPSRRLVATDVSPSMLEFARRENSHDDIMYDLLDISSDEEVTIFVENYGRFQRIYSLLCFHFLPDDRVAFRNVARLLTPGGQCLVSSALSDPAVDAWEDLYKMPEWNSLIPDPAVVFPPLERFRQLRTATNIEQDTRRRVTEAGLDCLMCDVKMVPWHFQDIGKAIDKHLEEFKINVRVPLNKREAFKRDYTECLRAKVPETPSGCELTLGMYRVLATLR